MKPYFLVIYNFLKIRFIALKNNAILKMENIELFSKNTKFIFKRNSHITIEKNVVTDGKCVIVADKDARLFIGNHVYMNENAMISCKEKITIGARCKFGPNVNIFDNNHIFYADTGVHNEHSTGEINIEEGCWLGANVVVLKNTKIGKNSVIGAGCVVSGVIPPASIVTQNRELKISAIK